MSIRGVFIASWLLSSVAQADDVVDYVKSVKPVLQARCYACHGVLKQKAGLRLDTVAFAIKGGDSGAALQPGDVAGSELLARISSKDDAERMPPEGEPLKAAEIATISAWIAQGAKVPADDQPERDPREHWAFKAPVRPAVPVVTNQNWVINPIDAFIAAQYQVRGLLPQRAADKRIWLRRVSLDLTGLPPSPAEVAAFVGDNSPTAYDQVVTRLLDSPQYGERWGRHWMDIWRYSDWWGLGAEVRNSQKHIWHWRDWIIESLNSDQGYDQMLREMLAADELYPDDQDRLRASGFLARQYFKFNRTSWLDETIEHTSKAMLGLTFNCAKCHDHKYDPFSQVEYYRLRAVFEPYQVRTDAVPGEIDPERDGLPRTFDCNVDAQTYLHIRGDDRNPDQTRVITPGIPAFLAFGDLQIAPISLPVEAYQPQLRAFVINAHVKAATQSVADAQAALRTARQKLAEAAGANSGDSAEAHAVTQARAAVEIAEKGLAVADAQLTSILPRAAADRARYIAPSSTPEQAAELIDLIRAAVRAERVVAATRADEAVSRAGLALLIATPDKKGEAQQTLTAAQAALTAARSAIELSDWSPPSAVVTEAAKGESKTSNIGYTSLSGSLKTFESNLETEESRSKPYPSTSTGRRSALARWITDPRHPLPARVAVNHMWSRHFGKALVPTLFDFGRKGTPPTHPELLDWLAVEFVEHGWSMKHIHRLIVTSNTYRLSSSSAGVAPQTFAADPDNQFHWRANSLRMEAQAVRDSLLALAGELDLKRGGPPIPLSEENSRRRSLYYVHTHNEHQKFLAMFDDASVLECYRRSESIVPQQALALENSPLVSVMAEKIAQRIAAAVKDTSDREFIRAAFLTVLAAEPSEPELKTAEEALVRLAAIAQQKQSAHPAVAAKTHLVQALLNHNDFITIR